MKKYIYRLMGTVLLILLITMAWNYAFDTSGLFNCDFKVRRGPINEHFVKMRYILSEPQKYNAFCFGSSRVGNIDLKKINNGYRYYNMTYPQGVPVEWLNNIKTFLKYGVSIKQIMIGIDDFSFRVDPETHKRMWVYIPYTDGKNISTYFSYLTRKPVSPYDDDVKKCIYDIYDTGRPLHPEADEEIEADVEKHLSDERFKIPNHYEGNRIDEAIGDLRQIKDICDTNGIDLLVFINPINAVTYRDTNIQEFNEFKYQLAQIMDYYDFSGLNYVTTNNYYYYETSHYRPLVGDMIVNRLFNNGNADFGVYVTKENVEEHLQNLENELQ